MPQKRNDFTIRYDKSEISYITQFLVSPGQEDVLIDLSPGLLNDGSEPKTLPIQTRIALPWSATERLAKVLNEVVAARKNQTQTQRPIPAPTTPVVPQATIPQVSQ